MWPFKLLCRLKDLSQIAQLTVLKLWTLFTWTFKLCFNLKVFSQMVQVNWVLFSWWFWMWWTNFCWELYFLLHVSQVNIVPSLSSWAFFTCESIPGEASVLPFLGLRTLLCLCANTNQASYTIPVFNKHERQSSFINFISFHQASIKLLTTKQSRLAFLNYSWNY